MKIYINPQKNSWSKLAVRPAANPALLEKKVTGIMHEVKANGDRAIRKFTKEFDGVESTSFQVTNKEMNEAEYIIDKELKKSIQLAKKNITTFHTAQKEKIKKIVTMPGVTCWRKSLPVEKVGLYIPGGTAPLFSTLLMLGIPAQLAGCKEVIVCTPPAKDGSISPSILYTAKLCGITKIYKVGGVQAIAALVYGTETVPKVFKIFGPGNQYVMAAKQMAQLEAVAIDMPAGPSEVLVIADETAIPAFVTADLLSQMEHGPDSQAILVTTNKMIASQVTDEINKQIELLPRKKIAAQALQNSKIIIVKNSTEAIEFSNLYAPEHLILSCKDAARAANQVTAAGSVFIGNYSPESGGDYASGTNHTLPTNGYAAMYSGVSLDSFMKKITFQHLTEKGLRNIGKAVMTMAEAEGLEAHKNAISVRLKK